MAYYESEYVAQTTEASAGGITVTFLAIGTALVLLQIFALALITRAQEIGSAAICG
jgi:hypothetical protein